MLVMSHNDALRLDSCPRSSIQRVSYVCFKSASCNLPPNQQIVSHSTVKPLLGDDIAVSIGRDNEAAGWLDFPMEVTTSLWLNTFEQYVTVGIGAAAEVTIRANMVGVPLELLQMSVNGSLRINRLTWQSLTI